MLYDPELDALIIGPNDHPVIAVTIPCGKRTQTVTLDKAGKIVVTASEGKPRYMIVTERL